MYKTINSTIKEDSICKDKDESQIIDFLGKTNQFFLKPTSYLYPIMEDQMSLKDRILSNRLGSISLLPSDKFGVFTNFLMAFYLGIFGIVIMGVSYFILQIDINYSEICGNKEYCTVPFYVPTMFPTPIYFYYELTEFYSNHHAFQRSINEQQMQGQTIDYEKQCPGAYLQSDMPVTNRSAAGFFIDQKYANPCGLAAKFFFNDSYTIQNFSVQPIGTVLQTQLQLPMYMEKFERHPQWQFTQWIDFEDEQAVNWFTIQPHQNRIKLWAQMQGNLPQGNYYLQVQNHYNTSIFGGMKNLIILSGSELGAYSLALGSILLGGTIVYMMNGFFIMYMLKKRFVQVSPDKLKL